MGGSKEREMVNDFIDAGWGALRLGGSGSGGDHDLPDVLAGNGGTRYLAIEEKYRGSSKQCYIGVAKRQSVSRFCTMFGAEPIAAVRYSTRLEGVSEADWYLAPFSDVPRTDSGKMKLHHSVVIEDDWALLSDLF